MVDMALEVSGGFDIFKTSAVEVARLPHDIQNSYYIVTKRSAL
jgi:hypothetical protein